jgi:hypothetical protein
MAAVHSETYGARFYQMPEISVSQKTAAKKYAVAYDPNKSYTELKKSNFNI